MDKKIAKPKIILFSSVILILFAFFLIYFFVIKSSVVPAQLHIISGEVLLNDKIVAQDTKLKEGDKIETKEQSMAAVILYESVIIDLDPSTTINLEGLAKKHPKVFQELGTTWNTFTKLSGVEEYTINSGNSIASVRATSFGFREGYILGGEGVVNFTINGKSFSVSKNNVVEKVGEEIIEREATYEEKEYSIRKIERGIEELKYLRDKEIKNSPIIISTIKKITKLDDEELRNYLEKADNNQDIDVDSFVSRAPVKTNSLEKIAEITKSIQILKVKLREI